MMNAARPDGDLPMGATFWLCKVVTLPTKSCTWPCGFTVRAV